MPTTIEHKKMPEQLDPQQVLVNEAVPEYVQPEFMYEDHISRDAFTGLGRAAVRRATDIAAIGGGANEDELDRSPVLTRVNREILTEDIQKARTQLEEMAPEERRRFQDILDTWEIPGWFNEVIGADEHDIADPRFDKASVIVSKLTQKDSDGNYSISDETFLTFLHIHNHNLAQAQKELDERLPEMQARFEQRLVTAVEAGIVPAVALERFHDRVNTTLVVIDDGLNTHSEKTSGYMRTDSEMPVESVIALSPILHEEEAEYTFTHEMMHVISGKDGDYAQLTKLLPVDAGDMRGILNEAITEYLTLRLWGNSHDDSLSLYNGAYPMERELFSKMMHLGDREVASDLFVRAYFEDSTEDAEEADSSAVAAMVRGIEEGYPGFDVNSRLLQLKNRKDMTRLSEDIDKYHKHRTARKVAHGLRKIHVLR